MIHGPCTNCGSKTTTSYFDKSRNRTRIQWCTVNGNEVCKKCYNDHRYNLPEVVRRRKKWLDETKEYRKGWKKQYYDNMRTKVIQMITKGEKPKCMNCGCDNIDLLEINHIDGGGTKENKCMMLNHIVFGRRKLDDLDMRCKVCNSLHYLELVHGDLPFKIIWN